MPQEYKNTSQEYKSTAQEYKNANVNKEEQDESLIKIKAYHFINLFPKAPAVLGTEGNDFGIAKFEVVDTLQGSPVIDKKGLITIKGSFFSPIENDNHQLYIILAKREDDEKWGIQYRLLYITQEIDFHKVSNLTGFLKSFMTEGQIAEFYKVYDNPLEIIINHDVDKMTAVHGVGPYIANCIINRYEANADKSKIYIELDQYGLTPSFIQRLIKAYKDPNLLIKAVKDNPYQLIDDIDGVGFLTADKIALAGGISPKSSKRIEAYIAYFLNEEAENGNSYISAATLMAQIYAQFGGKEAIYEAVYDEEGNITGSNIATAIKNLQNKDVIIVEDSDNKAQRRVYLKKIYELEQNIAFHLKRLLNSKNRFNYADWHERVERLEQKQGFAFDDTQLAGIKLGLDNQVCLICGAAGCVDADTEFFTGAGWKKISEYQPGDKVLQWDIDGNTEIVEPVHYIKQPNSEGFNVICNQNHSIYQKLSDNHLVPYFNNQTPEDIKLIKCKDLVQKYNESEYGFLGRMHTNFIYNGSGIDYTDEQIKISKALKTKCFPINWYNCSLHQKEVIFQELVGECEFSNQTSHHILSIKNKQDADFIQFVCTSIGYNTDIYYSSTNAEYVIEVANERYTTSTLQTTDNSQRQEIQKIPSQDGYEYCFEVPSGYLVLRCEEHIFVTHNCGKSSLVSGILASLADYTFATVALAGKAAARLQEVTGSEGSTIHRLLEYKPGLGFTRDASNPLEQDIIILDEISMVGGEIFLKLLEAIPNGTKLIMCGDANQLESVGILNLAADMIASPIIPSTELTEIHRQAAKSGILVTANQIRQSKTFFDSTYEGQKKIGEMKDMTIDIAPIKDSTLSRAMSWYQYWLNSELVNQDVMKIQLLAPVKERGNACVYNLNLEAQNLVNPVTGKKQGLSFKSGTKDKPFAIRVNDKVMCVKNNYHVFTLDNRECSIYNGWSGIVKNITPSFLEIYFPLGKETVYLDYETAYKSIVLGYASSTHKYQGTEVPVVIGVLDYSCPPNMLTKQLLYTMITRAKKQCVLVGQNSAINQAINTDFVSTKKTFLQELLLQGEN